MQPPDKVEQQFDGLSRVRQRAAVDRGIPPDRWVRVVDTMDVIEELADHDGRIYRITFQVMKGTWEIKEDF